MSYLAFLQRDQERVNPIVPAVGVVGATGFFFLMLRHLLSAERGTFWAVVILAVAGLAVEVFDFERETMEEEVVAIEEVLAEETPGLSGDDEA